MDSRSLHSFASDLSSDETGATAIEYALIAGLMALVCVAAFTQLGAVVEAFYTITATLVDASI